MPEQVYFVKSGSHVKIGTTKNVAERLKGLKTGNPVDLTLLGAVPGGVRLERAIHKALIAHHARDEWFHDAADVRALLARLLEHGAAAVTSFMPAEKPPVSPLRAKIAKTAKRLWPHGAAKELAARTGQSLRTAEKYLSQDRGMGLDAFGNLLLSDEGPEFFFSVIGDKFSIDKIRAYRDAVVKSPTA